MSVYSEKVKDVLEFVKDHPINIKSQKMFYGKSGV